VYAVVRDGKAAHATKLPQSSEGKCPTFSEAQSCLPMLSPVFCSLQGRTKKSLKDKKTVSLCRARSRVLASRSAQEDKSEQSS